MNFPAGKISRAFARRPLVAPDKTIGPCRLQPFRGSRQTMTLIFVEPAGGTFADRQPVAKTPRFVPTDAHDGMLRTLFKFRMTPRIAEVFETSIPVQRKHVGARFAANFPHVSDEI